MLHQLRIKNFKCFKDSPLPFGGITLITGGNGVGKSSVIQSLLLLRQLADVTRRAKEYSQDAVRIDGLPVRLNGAYELNLGNSTSVTNSELESQTVILEITGPRTPSSSIALHANSTDAQTTISVLQYDEAFFSLLDGPAAVSLFAPEFHYLVAERVGPRELYNIVDQDFVNTGYRGEATAHAIARGEGQEVEPVLRLSEESPLLKVQLQLWMQRVVPHVQLSTSPYPEINKVRIAIRKDDNAAPTMSPANIGFGISYSLPIVVSGLLARPGTAFIVENPEAHLHPSAQSAIGYFLALVASAGVQVVVETHSEHVVNGVRLAVLESKLRPNLVRLLYLESRPGDTEPRIEPISVDELAELDRWPAGFFDQQTADLSAMFQLRRSRRATGD